ncbi:hypothetical protein CLIB1423_03S03158 [[Candida] railenensis]|uniref:Uncharacterized protein n=1 Tax=[Candida] railenensis TaxID=45579 RepID=A0A9P0QMJ1_9ASCO|nr:hypothetical protein CLIB1423_03S03158 [[Candida] railenensis]
MSYLSAEELCLEEISIREFECECRYCHIYRSEDSYIVSLLYWGLVIPGYWVYCSWILVKFIILHPNKRTRTSEGTCNEDHIEAILDHSKNRSKLWDYLGYGISALVLEFIVICSFWLIVKAEGIYLVPDLLRKQRKHN